MTRRIPVCFCNFGIQNLKSNIESQSSTSLLASARIIPLHVLTRTPETSRAGTLIPTLWMHSWSLRPAKTSQKLSLHLRMSQAIQSSRVWVHLSGSKFRKGSGRRLLFQSGSVHPDSGAFNMFRLPLRISGQCSLHWGQVL